MSAHLLSTIGPRIGPQLVGIILSAVSTGVALVQTQHYFQWSTTDPIVLRGAVGLLCALTLTTLCTNTAYLFELLIGHFGDLAFQALDPPVFVVNFMVVPFEIAIGQTFFLWRMHGITKNLAITAGISFLIVATFAANLVVGICAAGGDASLPILTRIKLLVTSIQAGAWLAAGTDLILCAIFVYKLRKFITTDKTGNNSVLKSLLTMALSTTMFTTVLSFGNALATKLESEDRSHYQLLFSFMIPYSYQMSMLFVLNSRRRLRLIQEGKSTSSSASKTGGALSRGGFQFQLGGRTTQRGGDDHDVQVSFPMDSFTPTEGNPMGGITVDVEKSMHVEDGTYDRV